MATKSAGAADGFLRRQLADGCRPFRYRARIRALLGEIESDKFRLGLPGPLPMAAFAQRRRAILRDADLPDAGAGRESPAFTSEVPPSTRPSVAVTPYQPASQLPRDSTDAIQRAVTVHQVIIPGSAGPDAAPVGVPSADARAVSMGPHPRDERVQQALSRHEVTIPGVRQSLHAPMPRSGTGSVEVKVTPAPAADSTVSPAGIQAPRPAATGGVASANPTGGSIEPVTVGARLPTPEVVAGTPHQRASAFEKQELRSGHSTPRPGAVLHEPSDGAAPSQPAKPHRIAVSSSHAAEPVMGGLFPARRADARSAERRTPRESGGNPHAATETDHRQAPAPPPPESPVIVVKQVAGPGTSTAAFWQRRHLSRLRDRVRR